MICQHENCTRRATQSNNEYFKGIWYCTFHANKITKKARINKKLTSKQ